MTELDKSKNKHTQRRRARGNEKKNWSKAAKELAMLVFVLCCSVPFTFPCLEATIN